jgi:hypothetical protein
MMSNIFLFMSINEFDIMQKTRYRLFRVSCSCRLAGQVGHHTRLATCHMEVSI